MDEIEDKKSQNESKSADDANNSKMEEESVNYILELAKEITELKKIKKRLQAQINFSKKGKSSKEENPQKEGDSPEL